MLRNLFIIASLFVTAEAASALPTQSTERTYFTSASFKVEAGFEIRPSCQGTPSPLRGRRTRFVVVAREKCQTGRLQQVACYLDGRLTRCPANICDSPLVNCP